MDSLAFVCAHLETESKAIAWALRDEPASPSDSGWRLLCAASEVGKIESEVTWTIERLVKQERGLEPHIGRPPGAVLRKQTGGYWHAYR